MAFHETKNTGTTAADALVVEHATLVPGRIVLVLANDSEDPARVAQVILEDAFVDFHASQGTVAPGDAERIVIPIRGSTARPTTSS